jgi:hypothetical protein
MKKVLIIGGCLVLVLGAMAVAGLVYVGYRVKGRVEEAAAELKPELGRPSLTSPPTTSAKPRIDVCTLLSKEEASQILGVTIERTQSQAGQGTSTCQYFAKAGSQADAAASLANAFAAMAKGGATPEPSIGPDRAYQVGRQTGAADLLKGVSGMANPGGPYTAVTVTWENGGTVVSMYKVVGGVSAPGVKTMEDLTGIGDEAIMGPMDSLIAFVKGPTGVQIDLSKVPHAREKGVALARTIAGRL